LGIRGRGRKMKNYKELKVWQEGGEEWIQG